MAAVFHVLSHGNQNTSAGTKETDMLGNKDAVANVAVKDLDLATDFYRNTLGLKPVHQEGKELVVFQSGHSSINVYRSEYAGTNKATAVTWTVESVEMKSRRSGAKASSSSTTTCLG
jgi:hypothetical protein